METTNKHSDNGGKQQEAYVQFKPSGEIKMFTVSSTTTIRDLKILSEEKCGIPSDMLIFMHKAAVLKDETAMLDLDSQSEYTLLDLCIQPPWEKFIYSCFKRENEQVLARIHIKMNHLNCEARAFVAAFIAAQKGNSTLFQSIIESHKNDALYETVRLSGRSLLHAAVWGGNISCVMTIIINGGWKLLHQADRQQEIPLEMAQRMKKEGLVQILKKYVEMYTRNDAEKERVSGREDNTKQLSGDKGPDDRPPGSDSKNGSSTARAERHNMVPKPPAQGRDPSLPVSKGYRLLKRSDTPQLKLHIPAPGQQNGGKTSPTTPKTIPPEVIQEDVEDLGDSNNNSRVNAVKLPVINVEVSEEPVSPRSPRMELLLGSRRGSLPKSMGRVRSPSSPTPQPKQLLSALPHNLIQRPRSRTTHGEGPRFDGQTDGGQPCFAFGLSSSAPTSPTQTRKRQSMPVSSLARPGSSLGARMSLRVDQGEPGFARQLQAHLMSFDQTRKTLPWNVWKSIRAFGADKANSANSASSDESSDEDEDEEEKIRKYLQMSGHRKSFEIWLAAKENDKMKKSAETESEARRVAEQKALEEVQRRMKGKTFDEWLKEKETKLDENVESDVTDAQKEARRAEAFKKYQLWMKKKDEQALALEEKLREEERRKYEEEKRKREEQQRQRWLKKKAAKTSSLPV